MRNAHGREWVVGAPEFGYGLPNEPGSLHLFTSRDCHATAQNYGAGWPGTNGVPSLTASNPPQLGEPISIDLGNSYGQPTIALLLFGFAKAQISSSWDGDFLVAAPWVPFVFSLPAAGLALDEEVEPDLAGNAARRSRISFLSPARQRAETVAMVRLRDWRTSR